MFIPARYASSRLPGKALIDVGGKPLIRWVADAALASGAARVVVCTDDQRIADAVSGQVETCMTDPKHPSGTDRIAEAVKKMQIESDRVIVNLQGDEPDMPPAVIRQVAQLLEAEMLAAMATACYPITEPKQIDNPNIVKVVCDFDGRALYFSRAPIPYPRDGGKAQVFRHIGLYAYHAGFLSQFVQWPVCAIEAAEQLEQLRALYYGATIMVAEAEQAPPIGIDTEDDLQRFKTTVQSQA